MQAASQLICQEIIRAGITYQFVMVRNDEGKMKLFLNGYLCSSGTAVSASRLLTDKHKKVICFK